ncbi:type II secretion system minor pseudopilin GspI [Maricaulis sp.]|uniref:type II secretion system minor pseudopilin GspI n=1 Tax=Maricaulis sp. TaxID=1486257 RepID=UPI003A95A584
MSAPATHYQSGFSLIEVLMAVVVLALGGLAMLSLMQSSTRNAAMIQERSLATLAAENLLNEALLAPALSGDVDGHYDMAGTRYAWSLELEPTTDRDLKRVLLVVTGAESGRELARIETFRRGSSR